MKTLASKEFQEYTISLINSEYKDAERALRLCISIAKRRNDKTSLSFLTTLLGDLHFRKGNAKEAISHYVDAEAIDPAFMYVKWLNAKFLENQVEDHGRAIEKCDEIIAVVSSESWRPEEDDLRRNYYLGLCYALKGYCYCRLTDFERAGDNIKLLLNIGEPIFDFSVEFCEQLIVNDSYSTEARTYLCYLADRIKAEYGSDKYKDLLSHISEVLCKNGRIG